jgi:hypothetical protein
VVADDRTYALAVIRRSQVPLLISVIAVLGLAASASADVLVQAPPKVVSCVEAMQLGVWYQSFSGGPRWFSVSVYRPDGRRVFYRHGLATTTWKIFRYRPASDPGVPPGSSTYRVVYRIPGGNSRFPVRVECYE